MAPVEPGVVIDLQQERLRRGMKRYHREPIQTWRRKVKLTLAATAVMGVLAGLLAIAMESTDSGPRDSEESEVGMSPFRPSGGGSQDVEAESAWFTATGGGRR